MASHKNQHFVPRCYLKPFSVDGDGRAINVYNVDRRLGIQNAPVRGQCSHSYFYGEDLRLEKLLQHSENWYSTTLSNIEKPGYRLTELDLAVLSHFCYLQHCRTEAALRRAALSMSEMMDVAYDGDIPADKRTTMRDVVQMGMRAFSNTMHIVYDLKVCLVRNTTRQPFITSDDPAVLANRWYSQNPRAKGLSGGTGNAGVLFVLPLTPNLLCLVYDGGVYSVPNARGWVTASKISDIDAFNEHQFLGCLANIYFDDWAMLAAVDGSLERVISLRPTVRHETFVTVLEHEDEWGEKYRVVRREDLIRKGKAMIHVRTIRPQPTRWPSIIRWRSDPKIYSNGSGTGFLRRSTASENSYMGPPYKLIT
jgi:hypothetical protein